VSKEAKEILDSKLDRHPEFRIKCNSYGLNISGFWEILVFIGVPLSASIVVFYMLSPTYMWVGAIIAIVPMLLSKYVHPLLHEKRTLSDISFSWLGVIVSSRYFKYIQRYHFIHHQYSLCNFNLMLGGDYLLGVSRKAKSNNIGTGSYMAGHSSVTKGCGSRK